jgi:TP901 family phage tail tape measure protein
MPNDATLSIIVKLQDEASAGLASLSAKVSSLSDAMTSKVQSLGASFTATGAKMVSMGESMQYAGQKMSIGLTVPLVALGVTAAKSASDFEDAMLKIQTGAGASATEIAGLSKTILQMASSGAQQTPLEIANGMYFIESAGYHGADAVNVLKAAMDGANVSGVNLNTVSQQLVTVMNATHSQTSDAQSVMALLNSTVGQGVMTMNDLIGAMSTGIIPKAQVAGIGINDVAAALDTMTREGVPAQKGATELGMALALISAPSSKATKALESLGLTQFQIADEMHTKGLLPALEDLKAHLTFLADGSLTDASKVALQSIFGGGRTAGGAELLIQNLGQMKTALDGLSGGAANFTGYVQAQGETTAAYYNRMKASASAAAIQIGNAMAPLEAEVFPKLAAIIEAVANWFDKLSPTMQKVVIGGLAIFAALGPVLIIFGSLFTAIGTISIAIGGLITFMVTTGPALWGAFVAGGPILWAIVAVVVLLGLAAYEMYKHWDTVKPLLLAIWNLFKFSWNVVIDFLSDKMLWFANIFTAAWKTMSDIFHAVWDALISWYTDNVVTPILNSIQVIIDAFKRMVAIVSMPVNIVSNIGNAVGGFVSHAILPQFEQGGIVPGAAGQAVPIIAHAGEEVIPANQVGRRGAGNNVTIIIQNPTVRSQSDISEMRRQIEAMMRPILLNAKVAHI